MQNSREEGKILQIMIADAARRIFLPIYYAFKRTGKFKEMFLHGLENILLFFLRKNRLGYKLYVMLLKINV